MSHTNNRNRMLGIGATGTLLLACGLYFFAFQSEAARPNREQRMPPAGYSFAESCEQKVPVWYRAAGVLSSENKALVSAQISGVVSDFEVELGEEVPRQSVVVQIRAEELEAQKARVASQLLGAEAQLKLATSHHERMQELYKQSAATLEQLEQAQQRLSDVTAQVAATQEMLREAEIHLHYSTVAAPFTGVIGERFVDPGDFVWPGRPLFSIYDPETARVEAMIPERYIQQLSLGMESKVEVEALGKVFTAKVAEIRPHVDPKTRAFVTKCDVTDGDKQLFPGMFGTLLFQTGERSAILVPSNAVHQLGQLSFIWVQVGREWQKRYVTLGRSHEGDRIEILSGISANETIAVMNRGTRG